ncbi:ABC transporter permease [Bacillus sp. SD088]|uniref:ABC transporter permease n=1 Tax=Bacillus sp. SD088 TaxID=2782012 RepID=UPI001A96F40E|nr:ABC transporter permease [Bacillus sp. SD088]MBO0992434.1 ABC transporter permease [Bacillus sp. SD088]
MKSKKLFWMRLKQGWEYRFGTIKSIIDWTVFVYFILPATVISFFIYRSWWIELPGWIDGMSIHMLALFFLLLWGEHFHTYVREADRIFLRKNKKLFLQLKQWGIFYSYCFQCLSAVGLGIAIAPFWYQHFHLHTNDFFLFAGLWVSLKWLIMSIKGKLNVQVRGWRSLFRGIPLVMGALIIWELGFWLFTNQNIVWLFLLILLNTGSSFFFVRRRFSSVHNFEQDLAIDELEKNKYTETIFQLSMDIEKPRFSSNRAKPRLYAQSNRLFKRRNQKTGYLELFIKAFTRDSQYILQYFQIISVTGAAIVLLPPLWLKITVMIAGVLFLITWIGNAWRRTVEEHPFARKYPQEVGYFQAKKLVASVLLIPFIIIVVLLVIVRFFLLTQIPNL